MVGTLRFAHPTIPIRISNSMVVIPGRAPLARARNPYAVTVVVCELVNGFL